MKNKILYLLLSVVIAFGLGGYVITTVSPEWEETYYDIPVALKNEKVLHENGLMLNEKETPTVTLRLKGNRSDLINLNKSDITLVADLAKIYESGQQSVSYSISSLGNSIEILEQSPMEITLSVVERATKEVPVKPVYNGKVPEGFRTDTQNLALDHETITVTGPAKVINTIDRAEIQVDLEGQTSTISQSYQYILCDDKGNEVNSEQIITDVDEVNLTLKIQRYKEIALKLNVIPGGGATEKNSVIEKDLEEIQVSGSEQLLESLGDTLEFELKLADYLEDTTVEFEIKLPEGVENLTGKSVLTVKVSFPDLVKETFRVSDITYTGLPAGMAAKILTKEVTVTLRGTKAQIEAITEEDLSISVDLSAAELGTDTYKALINTGKYGSVGAVGSYSVYVEVTASARAILEDK